MPSTPLCLATYQRPAPDLTVIQCTYPSGHEQRQDDDQRHHSWYAIQVQDQVEAAAPQVVAAISDVVRRPTAELVQALVDTIMAGAFDRYREVLLSALHERKRNIYAERSAGRARVQVEHTFHIITPEENP